MKFFKKLFANLKKEKKKEKECWYNNAHENEKDGWAGMMTDPGSLSGENQMYYSTAQQAAKHQN